MSAAAAAVGLALGGCGVEMPDVLALSRTGRLPAARLSLVVNDAGTVRCNRGRSRRLPSALLLDARDLARRIERDAARRRRFPPRPGSQLSYVVRVPEGSVAWSDTSRPLRPAYFRLALLARQIARDVCGRPR